MTTPAPGGLGRTLRAARERRGVSLREIADATKISIAALEALERNDVSRLPGGIFSRAFVRAYAIAVGLDPEAMIQEFIAQFPQASVTAGHPAHAGGEDHEAVESSRQVATTIVRLGAVSVLVVALLLYFGAAGRRRATVSSPASPRVEAPAPLAAAPPALPEPAATAATEPAVPAADGAGQDLATLTVAIAVTGDSWISATVDGRKVIERTMKDGEREVLEVRDALALTAGDAAAVSLSLNGAPARPLGTAGRAVNVRVTPANFRTFLGDR